MAHRMGRPYARETYPERPRFGASLGPFARNGAVGPGPDVDADPGGAEIPWVLIESTGLSGTDIPITPKHSATLSNVIIQAVLGLHNTDVAAQDVTVQILVDGTPLPLPAIDISIPSASFAELPILGFANLPAGITANVSIVVTGDADVNIVQFGSTINVQEVATATG